MNLKMRIKSVIDILMTVVMLMLMAYQIIGEKFHEWFGAGMIVLFVVHNLLNCKWYGTLFKGKYKVLRIFRMIINFMLFAAMLSLAYSGIVMSRHVFAFLPINGGIAFARVMHLAGSWWGFVLMSIHLGLHWGMVIGIFCKLSGGKAAGTVVWIMRLIAVLIAGYGAGCFYRANIFSYLFLKVEFAFFDYEKSVFSVFIENMSMMGLWVFIAYYGTKAIEKLFIKN